MALSRVVSEISNVEKYHDLEIPVKGQSGLLKVVPYDRLGMISYIVFSSNFVTVFEIFDL